MSHAASFARLLAKLRLRAWVQGGVYASATALLVAGVAQLVTDLPILPSVLVAVALEVLVFRRHLFLRRTGAAELAAHLDRCFPALEESSRLLLVEPEQLDVLQRLQRARIAPRWSGLVEQTSEWLPALAWRRPTVLASVGALLFALNSVPWPEEDSVVSSTQQEAADAILPPRLQSITVTPPEYTGLDATVTDEMDLSVSEGAALTWRFDATGDAPLRLVISDGQNAERYVALDPRPEGGWVAQSTIEATSLYRIERRQSMGYRALPGVYSIAVTLDQPPRLRLLQPKRNQLELVKDAVPEFLYRVAADDDYGVAAINIVASVAKGSGEGVKFRDETFEFDRCVREGDRQICERFWDLRTLGMTPGDEVYLFATAVDNHPSAPQRGRSDTLVVRWLDDTEPMEVGEGLAISVMPEYFKSQRQIIIETEQLIADRDALSETVFVQTARDLGTAQAELKERYGQYLGDEFGESEAPAGLTTPAETADASDAAEDHDGHDHEGHDHAGHDHGGEGAEVLPQTAEALIARFGHDHGTADIGPITRQSPVGLMKRAVAAMWDAELSLKLADPEAALPHEYEALKYFDLARQADRIYTRRLGFEPPPVSEERRLSGDLDDVASREQVVQATPDPSASLLMTRLYEVLVKTPPGARLTADQLALLQQAAQQFTEQATQRPALIRAAATLEKLRLAGVMGLADCADCLSALRATVWSQLPAISPSPGRSGRLAPDALAADYLQVMMTEGTVRVPAS